VSKGRKYKQKPTDPPTIIEKILNDALFPWKYGEHRQAYTRKVSGDNPATSCWPMRSHMQIGTL
jgi:hypothetical protein